MAKKGEESKETAITTVAENPRAESLEQVMVVENKSKGPRGSKENKMKLPGMSILKVVSLKEAAGGIGGIFGALAIPKIVGWGDGWKDVVATGVVAFGGSWLVGKVSKEAGKAFAIGAVAVLGLKILKMALDATGFKLFGNIGQQSLEVFEGLNPSAALGALGDMAENPLAPTYTGI